jgi:hypothetical protein
MGTGVDSINSRVRRQGRLTWTTFLCRRVHIDHSRLTYASTSSPTVHVARYERRALSFRVWHGSLDAATRKWWSVSLQLACLTQSLMHRVFTQT